MARPEEFKSPKDLGVRVEAEELEALDTIRWREHLERSKIIRKAIQEYIQAHGEGNETFKLDTWQKDPDFQAVPTLFADNEKWHKYFKDSNKEDRNKVRGSIGRLSNIFNNVEFNEGRKKSPIQEYLEKKNKQ